MILPVYFEEHLVGEVHEDAAGPRFVYASSWTNARHAFPISITMPLDEHGVESARFLTWASNLLPEAEQLAVISRQLGVAQTDVLALLEAIGRDTAGALSFGAPGLTGTQSWQRIATDDDLERIIEELPRKPFLAGDDGVSMSLAGVQIKLAVACDADGHLYIPLDGSPSTHILKPDSDRLHGSVQNEAWCLTLARHCGLTVPPVTTGVAGDRQYFLIPRYDRLSDGMNWHRLHQEDFCQALGKPPSAKYERNRTGIRGPTIADMMNLVRRQALAPDALRLFDAFVFNVLACNTDAHAKNYSILIPAGSRVRTAPLYDVMCAEVFDGVTRNLAQTVADKNRGDYLKRRHWLRLAAACGLGAAPTIRRVRTLANRVLANVVRARMDVEAMPAGGDATLPMIVDAVTARCRAILAGLDDMEGVK
jgi:serine/threonine-protein kinase HipA